MSRLLTTMSVLLCALLSWQCSTTPTPMISESQRALPLIEEPDALFQGVDRGVVQYSSNHGGLDAPSYVVFEAVVDENGRLQAFEVVDSDNAGRYIQSAREVFRHSRFQWRDDVEPRTVRIRDTIGLGAYHVLLHGGLDPLQESDRGRAASEEDIAALVLSRHVMPQIPMAAYRQPGPAEVEVAFVVDEDGMIRRGSVLNADPEGIFDEAVQAALRQWRFEWSEDAEPRPVLLRQRFEFDVNLERQTAFQSPTYTATRIR
ncbi:TonB family protein [Gammaproteobacteria bacterium AB-CW1]|uniref:TonB family protein n=1 Tax=Natronospira elongata TaxID=3110268 RepID=A0AAP6JF63_9GAMM|nr:TonB family protein [Gammaproteobacteria bacterium AB-CW1]